MAAAKTLIPRQESALAEAFKRSLIEERWKNPNEAFYSIWPHSKARGFFWFYLMQGFGNKPKICVIITRIGLKHKINGLDIEGKCIEHFENKFETGMDCWYFENGKIKDLFHNKGVTQQLKDK
ncbi:MAG: hypothetical protein ACE5KE_02055, partial [Methanosarcinales archaeon]